MKYEPFGLVLGTEKTIKIQICVYVSGPFQILIRNLFKVTVSLL